MAESAVRDGNPTTDKARASSAMVAMGVIAILFVMIIPLPTVLLDILLSVASPFPSSFS
jgi:flagellar biosynthesis component FlhA